MKKIVVSLLGLMMGLQANAQFLNDPEKVFNEGKAYMSASLSGLDLNFNQENKFKLDLTARAGYMFMDDWMILADVQANLHKNAPNTFKFGAGVRYYFEQNGLYAGAAAHYVHAYHTYDDYIPQINVGYAFFISRTVTIEPEIYYDQSFKKHSDFSGIGLRIGFGIYLDDLF